MELRSRGCLTLMGMLTLWMASPAGAHEPPRHCPPGFNDTPAMPVHFDQSDLVHFDQSDLLHGMSFTEIFQAGQRIFTTDFNACDGAGRPGTNGTTSPRPVDPLEAPRFTRVSAPEATSCAGCHNEPEAGGAGDFVSNVFVTAQNLFPVSKILLNDDFSQPFLERNTLGMFGSGAIELLGREMTQNLAALKAQAIAAAKRQNAPVTVQLVTKGVDFGALTAKPDGTLDTSAVQGIDPDLIVKPFSRKGAFRSVREFTVTAMNQHHGMQAVERFGEGTDPDQDGVVDELTIGDITAVSVFQEALPVPIQDRHLARADQIQRGQTLFAQVGCTNCHVPALPLDSTVFCDPDPANPSSGPFMTFNDTSQSYCFDLRRRSGLRDNMVAAYTDLKRHVICDPNKPEFCNEPPSNLQKTDSGYPCPYNEFLTAKLWDVGNSAPYGHRGDIDTIFAAITAHGGEATASEAQFQGLPDTDQAAIVAFLKTLKMPIIPGDLNTLENTGAESFGHDEFHGQGE